MAGNGNGKDDDDDDVDELKEAIKDAKKDLPEPKDGW